MRISGCSYWYKTHAAFLLIRLCDRRERRLNWLLFDWVDQFIVLWDLGRFYRFALIGGGALAYWRVRRIDDMPVGRVLWLCVRLLYRGSLRESFSHYRRIGGCSWFFMGLVRSRLDGSFVYRVGYAFSCSVGNRMNLDHMRCFVVSQCVLAPFLDMVCARRWGEKFFLCLFVGVF